MAAVRELRGYIDTSGDAYDRAERSMALGCYVSDCEKWEKFEYHWSQVLGDYKIPYLHMSEMWDRNSPVYAHLRQSDKLPSLFQDLSSVIRDNITYCITSRLRVGDLRQFNSDHGLTLDGYSVCLYGLIISAREKWLNSEPMNWVLDKISKPHSVVQCAKSYAATDIWNDLQSDLITITPLEESESWKTALPLQACDWMAWELNKSNRERLSWVISNEDMKTQGSLYHAHREWRKKRIEQTGRPVHDDRKSAWALYKATDQSGFLWDYETLMGAHINRQKRRWGMRD